MTLKYLTRCHCFRAREQYIIELHVEVFASNTNFFDPLNIICTYGLMLPQNEQIQTNHVTRAQQYMNNGLIRLLDLLFVTYFTYTVRIKCTQHIIFAGN